MNAAIATFTIIASLGGFAGLAAALVALIFAPAVAWPVVKKLTTWLLDCTICVIALVAIVAFLCGYWSGRWGEHARGEADAIAGIARNDAVLVGKAKEGRSRIKDCRERGGAWVQTTGECR